jgi:hypothetical protein
MRNLIIALLLLGLAGCAAVAKIESGDRTIGDRLIINLDGAWNHLNPSGSGPAQIWTMEGLPIDQLLLYSGLKDGQAIHEAGPGGSSRKTFNFRSTMQPDEIAALFEGMLTRDGSSYKLVKLEPATFGGRKGFRFEYSLIRKFDNVQLSGVGYGTVSRGELFAIVYMAPRLAFFSLHVTSVENMARSARVKE